MAEGNEPGTRIQEHLREINWEFKFDSNLRAPGKHELGIQTGTQVQIGGDWGEMSWEFEVNSNLNSRAPGEMNWEFRFDSKSHPRAIGGNKPGIQIQTRRHLAEMNWELESDSNSRTLEGSALEI